MGRPLVKRIGGGRLSRRGPIIKWSALGSPKNWKQKRVKNRGRGFKASLKVSGWGGKGFPMGKKKKKKKKKKELQFRPQNIVGGSVRTHLGRRAKRQTRKSGRGGGVLTQGRRTTGES